MLSFLCVLWCIKRKASSIQDGWELWRCLKNGHTVKFNFRITIKNSLSSSSHQNLELSSSFFLNWRSLTHWYAKWLLVHPCMYSIEMFPFFAKKSKSFFFLFHIIFLFLSCIWFWFLWRVAEKPQRLFYWQAQLPSVLPRVCMYITLFVASFRSSLHKSGMKERKPPLFIVEVCKSHMVWKLPKISQFFNFGIFN